MRDTPKINVYLIYGNFMIPLIYNENKLTV